MLSSSQLRGKRYVQRLEVKSISGTGKVMERVYDPLAYCTHVVVCIHYCVCRSRVHGYHEGVVILKVKTGIIDEHGMSAGDQLIV